MSLAVSERCSALLARDRDRARRAVRRVVGAQGGRAHPDAVRAAAGRPRRAAADARRHGEAGAQGGHHAAGRRRVRCSASRPCSSSRRSRCPCSSSRAPPGGRRWTPRVGILFFLAVPSISVIGILLGGWSSSNTFATLGGLRGAAQMVSYEVPRTLSVLGLVLVAGSLRPAAVHGRLALVVAAAVRRRVPRVPDLVDRRDEPRPVRHPRGRIGDRRGLLRGLLGHPLGDLHDDRVRSDARGVAVRRRRSSSAVTTVLPGHSGSSSCLRRPS